jgi:hypothetical protein
VVDVLDFPLDPPDADRATGGGDFGSYRSRYNGIHAGEDWRGPGGRAGSFGDPVYSIGHGMVTYAAPLGWGVDQGVLIVRHVFADGSSVLSFYGHLDPPSVLLRAGECVARGQKVGEIGRPRTSPHLHFEIRTHMPNEPGPGYWPVDPTLAGWKPPSQFIWDQRIASAPGVQWTYAFPSRSSVDLGLLNLDTFVAKEGGQLVGLDVSGGDLRWSLPISRTATAMIDAHGSTLYTANRVGEVEALVISEPSGDNSTGADAGGAPLTVKWRVETELQGTPTLMPLPDGGVAVAARGALFGLSPQGRLMWQRDFEGRVFEWVLAGERLVITLIGDEGPVWSVDPSGPVVWDVPLTGRPIFAGSEIYLHAAEGIYRLDPEKRQAELLQVLPRGYPRSGDVAALPDGGLLVAHHDIFDRRLIVLEPDGTLRWQRSYSRLLRGRQCLLVVGGQALLVSQDSSPSSSNRISVYGIDLERVGLLRLFTGGSQGYMAQAASVFALGDERILFNVGGDRLVLLDTRIALEAASPSMSTQ